MSRPRHLWTAERDALLREMVAAGNTRGKCTAPINALPGDPITTERQIGRQMARLGIKLPAEAYRAVYRAAAADERFGRRVMTPERITYLRQASAERLPYDEILVGLNALPGPALKSIAGIRHHAMKNGISRPRSLRSVSERLAREREERASAKRNANRKAKRAAYAASWRAPREHAPPMAKRAKITVMPAAHDPTHLVQFIEPSPEIADAVTEDRYARVKAALRKKGADAAALARVHGMPLHVAFRLKMEVRREMRA